MVDAWAKKDRKKLAMIWANQHGEEKKFSFLDMSNLSNQAANVLLKYGINKGDRVLIMLPRIPEWWIFVVALIKLGAVFCPCPTMLTPRDIKYRVNKGKFRMIITDLENAGKVEEICNECPTLACRFVVDGERKGWASWPVRAPVPGTGLAPFCIIPDEHRTKSSDPMLIYFTSGTVGEPKMVLHNHGHPLGQIVTARFWQDIRHNDLHFTVTDTGWAKCGWGKIFGQWIEGACIFVYNFTGKFNATEILPLLEKYQITTFCCPPTVYRMLILADLDKFDLSSLRHCTSAGEPLNPEVIRVWKEGTASLSGKAMARARPAAASPSSHALKCGQAPWESPRLAGTWRSMMTRGGRSAAARRAGSRSPATPLPRAFSWSTLTTLMRTKKRLSTDGTTRVTKPTGTKRGSSGSSAGMTT